MKTNAWRWVERIISITVVVGMFIAWQKDKAVWSTKLETLIENDGKQEKRWDNQGEINGKFLILYDYFIPDSPGTGAEEGP